MTRDYRPVPGTNQADPARDGAWSLQLDREREWWDAS